MKTYSVTLTYKDVNDAGVSNTTNYDKFVTEETFNEIYRIICKE